MFMATSTHATLYSGEQVGPTQLVKDHCIVNEHSFVPSKIKQLLVPNCLKRTTKAASPSLQRSSFEALLDTQRTCRNVGRDQQWFQQDGATPHIPNASR